jgi:RNA polymerase sigma-70 factor (ECF subfamily)
MMPNKNAGRHAGDVEHPHTQITDDAALIESLRAGCEACFEILFSRYWKLVYAIAWRILRQQSEAEDVGQEVFLALYLQRDKYDATRGSVKTWIAQFAHFKALMRRKYLQTRELTDLDELTAFECELSRTRGLQGIVERSALVEQYLSALNPRQRRTVELIHFDGYTLLEASAVLRQSLANTRNLYYRGMKSLRSNLLAPGPPATNREEHLEGDLSNARADSLILRTDL